MIPKRRPKLMKKRCAFPNCDFSVFTNSITLKPFFYMSSGPEHCQKSVKNVCENGVGKCDAKSTQNIWKMCPKRQPKIFSKFLNEAKGEPKGSPRGAQSRPGGAKSVSKKPSASLLLTNIPPKSLLEWSWASFCFILEGF